MAVSLQTIASRAGITKAAVSMALRDHPSISPSRRQFVKQLAEEMGYRPNLVARGLVTGKTQTIGLISATHYSEVNASTTTALEEAAREHGYRIVACFHEGIESLEHNDIEDLLSRGVDGILGYPTERTGCRHWKVLGERRKPHVILGMNPPFAHCHIMGDTADGARQAIDHLVRIGRKRPAFVCGGTASYANQVRMEGWRAACEAHGIDYDARPLVTAEMDGSVESAQRLAEQLMGHLREFDAVLASNDIFAAAVYQALRRRQVRIPEDVALVGSDDQDFLRLLPVPLTSVRPPTATLGRLAFEMLWRQMEHPDAPFEQVTLKPELIVRESTLKKTME